MWQIYKQVIEQQ